MDRLLALGSKTIWLESLGRAHELLVPLNDAGSSLPFYCVHSISGKATDYLALARLLGPDQPLFAFQIPMAKRAPRYGGSFSETSILEIARHYADELERHQEAGPLILGGWSFGALIAFEMAQLLKARGRDVRLLIVFDFVPPNCTASGTGFLRRFWRTICFAGPWLCEHYLLNGSGKFRDRLRHWLMRKRQARAGLLERAPDLIEVAKYPAPQVLLMEELLEAAYAYIPRAYDGPVRVYCATAERPLLHLARLESLWKAIAPNTEIVRVPGAHQSLFNNGRSDVLREDLAAAIQTALSGDKESPAPTSSLCPQAS